jgi:hypothetical protein
VFVALGIQHEKLMRRIAICGLPRSTIFLHIFSQKTGFSEKKNITEQKMGILILSPNFDFIFKF